MHHARTLPELALLAYVFVLLVSCTAGHVADRPPIQPLGARGPEHAAPVVSPAPPRDATPRPDPASSPAPKSAGAAPALAELLGDRILLRVPLPFSESDEPGAGAASLIDAIARLLRTEPGIELVELAVHVERSGPDWRARKTSTARARALRKELARRGVEKNRLLAQGYGFLCEPDANGPAPAAREKTPGRAEARVELSILKRDGADTGVERGCRAARAAYLELEPAPGEANRAR